ncbi:hypothetical protein IWZ03DRAFT_53353 [Phyllosticta citriasiana]|uniref:C3H1-type domain-containing protein n=1 Tax=Phyllosticta citriasiana TaxID=595635 RepID=A0ABR1KCL6_9PEZI
MPRPRIPHGNRPRVPAGFGTPRKQSSDLDVGALSQSPHLSTHSSAKTSPNQHTAASPSALQHLSSRNMGEEDTCRRLGGSKHPSVILEAHSAFESGRGPGAPTSSTAKAMSPPVYSIHAPTGSGKAPTSHSLLGQSYKPPSKEKFAKLPAVTLVRTSQGPSNKGEVLNGTKAEGQPVAHAIDLSSTNRASQDKTAGKSLLGQTYQAPSTERFATVPAVKIVRSEPQKQDDADNGKPELSGVKLSVKENVSTAPPKTDKQVPVARGVEEKAIVENGDEGIARFSDDSGRRVCLANLPPGTSKTDIHDLLVSKASAKVSIENIGVCNFEGPRPNYALVEAQSEQEASRIAIWIDRECLFGWPISARVVRTMTKDQVNTVLQGETMDSPDTLESSTEDDAPRWATTTPQTNVIPCRFWEQGFCRNGSDCIFSHEGPLGMSARFNRHKHTEAMQPSFNLGGHISGDDLLGTRIYRGRFKEHH